jgi:hypothetical protein
VRALLLLAALLAGFLPGAAFAHNGEHHKGAADAQGGAVSIVADRDAWSPVCPPGSGHVCGCDNLSLSDAGAKAGLVIRCAAFFLPSRLAELVASVDAGTKPSPQFSPNLPRAPPLA